MARLPIPLIGPSYTNRSLPLSAQVSKNVYPEINPEARNIISLHAFPGLKEFSSVTAGTCRGSHVMNDIYYVIIGNTLWSVASDGTTDSKGSVIGNFIVDFADNGDQMVIVTGAESYIFTASTDVLAEITDASVNNPTTVGYLNNQFIYDNNEAESELGEFRTSQIATALTVADFGAALDQAEAQAYPDDITKVLIYNELVYFFGLEGFETWWNSGTGFPPFDKVAGGSRKYGLIGKNAIDSTDEFIYFLDDERVPRRMVGLQVASIGNPALGAEWADYVRVDDCIVYTYTIDHQLFVQYNFPTADKSWLFHEPSASWYEKGFGTGGVRDLGQAHEFVYGKNLVADHSNGKIYELDSKTYEDDGQVIQRRRTTAVIHGGLYEAWGKELFFDRVEFIVQTGEGLATGQGSAPVLMIRFSDDGGRTWSAERHFDMGVGGDYLQTIELQQQGKAFSRIYELTYSEPTPFALIDAHADISFGI